MVTRQRLRIAGKNAHLTQSVQSLLVYSRALTDTSRVVVRTNSIIESILLSWSNVATDRESSRWMDSFRRIAGGSRVLEGIERGVLNFRRPTRGFIERSTVSKLASRAEHDLRASWLYRWLTAEPEPEVIVIDLRDTFSVGPFIGILDQVLRTLVPASHRSTVRSAAEFVHDLVKDAPVRVGSVLFLVAVLSSLLLSLATEEPNQAGVIAHVIFLGLAAFGTRVTMTWDELLETRAVKLLIAALEPPEPPDEFDERGR